MNGFTTQNTEEPGIYEVTILKFWYPVWKGLILTHYDEKCLKAIWRYGKWELAQEQSETNILCFILITGWAYNGISRGMETTSGCFIDHWKTPVKKSQLPPKKIQQPLPEKKSQTQKDNNQQRQPSYQDFFPISFCVTS